MDTWLPIHPWTLARTRAYCDASGVAHHPAYDEPPGSGNWQGMPRVSCSFCVLAPRGPLVLAARRRPDLAHEYLQVEQETGHRFKDKLSMADIIRAAAQPTRPSGPIQGWKG